MYILKIFSKKWILFTLFVVGMMVLFVYLGFWQLDRHAQKRAYNTLLAERWHQEPFDLNQETLPAGLGAGRVQRAPTLARTGGAGRCADDRADPSVTVAA